MSLKLLQTWHQIHDKSFYAIIEPITQLKIEVRVRNRPHAPEDARHGFRTRNWSFLAPNSPEIVPKIGTIKLVNSSSNTHGKNGVF